jgi:hypothetical protein
VVLEAARLLEPAILKLLAFPKTTRTLGEAVHYLRNDHPIACEFLTRHLQRFQQALDDPTLLVRAKEKTKGRAKVLAEAIAGADYKLQFSTSRERVRRARKLADATSVKNSATNS